MPVKRGKDGRWRYREVVELPNGARRRINGSAPRHCNTKAACQQAFLDHLERLRNPKARRKEVPTFSEWFEGRFWREWVVARKNKPGERDAKRRHYKNYIRPFFGNKRLDEIGVSEVAQFRAKLVLTSCRRGRTKNKRLSEKYINNILAVLSKALRYAEDVELIVRAPKVGIFKTERPEVECWDFHEYARLLSAAEHDRREWYAAICLAGEAGLRVGEIKGLDWNRDIDLIARTLTVSRQIQEGHEGLDEFVVEPHGPRELFEGTPKGRTRRVVPITETLFDALCSIGRDQTGYVVCNRDGSPFTVGQVSNAVYRICRHAGLPERGWHLLRHCFGTHAAMFGANPWILMNWMGHKRIEETMRYVHIANHHWRPLPKAIVDAGADSDPNQRVIKMLSARSRGKGVAKEKARKSKAG